MFKQAINVALSMGLLLNAAQLVQAQTQTQAPAQTQTQTRSMSSSLGVIAYPPEDRTAQQIQEDESHCYNWSVNYTGIDPLAMANQPQTQQQGNSHDMAKGAAAGATVGVIIGDTGESAARGAAAGAVVGGISNRRRGRQQEDAQAQEQEATQSSMDKFRMGYGSCLTSRGYTVQ